MEILSLTTIYTLYALQNTGTVYIIHYKYQWYVVICKSKIEYNSVYSLQMQKVWTTIQVLIALFLPIYI